MGSLLGIAGSRSRSLLNLQSTNILGSKSPADGSKLKMVLASQAYSCGLGSGLHVN